MARKTSKHNIHEFTRQIHSTVRSGTEYSGMKNHDEQKCKNQKHLACHDCRFFSLDCYVYVGKYHLPCNNFEWW